MIYAFNTRNKNFAKLYKNLEHNGYYDPACVLRLLDSSIKGLSPYSKRVTTIEKGKIVAECCKNPWYVLREVLRTQIGSTKRFAEFTNGEALALLNFLEGGRTFVSAPVQTIKTNLLVTAIIMTLPKVVLYSNDKKGVAFISSIKKRYRQLVETMPDYLYQFYMSNFPEFIALSKHDLMFGLTVPGYDNSEIIIIQDNYEFDKWSTPENLRELEDARTSEIKPIRHLLVSSVNEHLDPNTKSYLDGIEHIQTPTIVNHKLENNTSSKMVSISLDTIIRLRSDRARNKYYKKIILSNYKADTAESLFITR